MSGQKFERVIQGFFHSGGSSLIPATAAQKGSAVAKSQFDSNNNQQSFELPPGGFASSSSSSSSFSPTSSGNALYYGQRPPPGFEAYSPPVPTASRRISRQRGDSYIAPHQAVNRDYVFQEKVPRWQEADKKELHPPSGTDRNRFDGVSPSIQELIRKVGDKYPLDMNFWRKYKSVPAMANVRDKDAILEILDNFAKIHRKHIYLFQRLKHTIVADMDHWNAPELAKVCASWAQLGFLTDRFTAEMSDRVVKTVGMCDTEALARLLDAYASTRTRHLRAPLKALAEASLAKIDLFSPQQLCLHCSSFARLNLAYEPIFDAIANRLCDSGEEALSVIAMAPEDSDPLAVLSVAAPGSIYSARDIALAAYSFGKLEGVDPTQQQQQQQQQTIIMGPTKGHQQEIANRAFDALAVLATLVLRDCTARELQMLATGFDRHRHHTPADQRKPFNSDLLRAMSTQAKRRIAQFSAESLVLFLRSFSNLCADSPDRDELMDVLLSRVSTHLPRAVATFKAIDLVTTLQVYARQGSKHSEVAGLLADSVVAKKSDLTPTDWVSVIHSVAAMNGPMSSVMKAARREGNDLIGKLKTPQLVTIITSCCGARYYRVDDLLPFIMELKSRTLHMPYASATDADTAAMIFIALSRMELPNNSSLDNSDVDDESRLLSLDNSLGLLAWLMPRLTSPGGGRPSAKLAEEVLECIADMDQADFREAAGGAEEVTCLAGEMLTAVRADSRGFSARPNSGAKRNSNFDYFSTDSSVGGDGNDDETVSYDTGATEERRQKAELLYMKIVHGEEHPARKYTATIPDGVLMRDLSERPSPFWL